MAGEGLGLGICGGHLSPSGVDRWRIYMNECLACLARDTQVKE